MARRYALVPHVERIGGNVSAGWLLIALWLAVWLWWRNR